MRYIPIKAFFAAAALSFFLIWLERSQLLMVS